MAIGITDNKYYIQIANAIREKNGSSTKYTPATMAQAILDLDIYIPVDEYTLLLIRGDKIKDDSQNNVAINNYGVTTTYQSGKSSLYFDGKSYLNIPTTVGNFGTKNFTVDTWLYPTVLGRDNAVLAGDGRGAEEFFVRSFGAYIGQAAIKLDVNLDNYSFPTNKWSHIAFVRSGNIAYIFIDGEKKASGNVTNISYSAKNSLHIGAEGTDYYYKGYMHNFRISNIARWTSNFPLP